jgi:hypothetical protein
MITPQLITTFITVIFGVIGLVIAHYFNSRRDRGLKRREVITAHLINAYKILANDITERKASPDRDLKLETVIAELQLFGSAKQIEMTKKLTDAIVVGGTFYFDDFLNDLRDELRKELELSPIEGNVRWLRLNQNKTK